MAEVCRRFEISRKTGYKWLGRYESGGTNALQDGSHAPHSNPRQVLDEVEDAIVEARGKHPHWGPVKLRAWLARTAPEIEWPAPSTIGEILRRHGLTVARERPQGRTSRANLPPQADESNRIWSVALAGWFCCQDGQRCIPLTIMDAHS